MNQNAYFLTNKQYTSHKNQLKNNCNYYDSQIDLITYISYHLQDHISSIIGNNLRWIGKYGLLNIYQLSKEKYHR